MLAIDDRPSHLSHSQGAYFDGSLELVRELAAAIDVDAALPRLSAIVSKTLPHDALRIVCLDQQGRPIVNASTADLPEMMAADADEVIIGDWRSGAPGATAAPETMERLVGAGYRSVLGCRRSHRSLWSAWHSRRRGRWPSNRAHVPLARRIAYHLGLGAHRGEVGNVPHHTDDARAPRADAGVPRRVDQLAAGAHLRVVGESVEWRGGAAQGNAVASTDTTGPVTGESGTGKEVVARFIHAASARRAGHSSR